MFDPQSTPLPTSTPTARAGSVDGSSSPVERLASINGGELVIPLKRKLFALFVFCVVDLIRAVDVIRNPRVGPHTHGPEWMRAAAPYLGLALPAGAVLLILFRRIIHTNIGDLTLVFSLNALSFILDTVSLALNEYWLGMVLAVLIKCFILAWTVLLVFSLVQLPTHTAGGSVSGPDDAAAAKMFQFVISIIPFWGPIIALMISNRVRRRD